VPVPLVTRILIADDFALVRQGLRQVLGRQPDLDVVAEAADGAEAVRLTVAGDVDLALLDVSMPRLTGLQAAREIARTRSRGARADALDARQRSPRASSRSSS
jgi:DNA-binding NarL/FixJ family response regulator